MKQDYRHGDVILVALDKLPKTSLKKVASGKDYVLAEGEVTGHKHVITAERGTKVEILKDDNGRYYLKVNDKAATLTHQEHNALTVEPGIYLVGKEQEHDYFAKENRRVFD